MAFVLRAILLFCIFCLPAAQAAAQDHPTGLWLGQDAHDYCTTAPTLALNDIQDLHIRIDNLPANEDIQSASIRRNGGGEWSYNAPKHWQAHMIRQPASTTADFYMEPSHDEPQCQLDIELRYRSGRIDRLTIKGGRSNPNLFMPGVNLQARWIGQDGHDWTGPGPAVGPDGCEDARIDISGLSRKLEIKSLRITPPDSPGWEYGLNPDRRSNAELQRDPKNPSKGALFFSPDRDLRNQNLTLRITYANDRSNSTTIPAGPTDPKRAMPRPAALNLAPDTLAVQWLGQDGKSRERGDVHILVEGLPPNRSIAAAALSDIVGGYWIYRPSEKTPFYSSPPAMPLGVQVDGANLHLSFQPYRDETKTPMALRLLLDDGATIVHRFTAGPCDPYLRGTPPDATSTTARPGDDLNDLAQRFGTIHLADGQYILTRPLKLTKPITLTGNPAATLLFQQPPNDPAWTGAIRIAASNTTLQGFSIRLSDNFRWATSAPGGAALIRTTDFPGRSDPKTNITLTKLDIQASTATPPADVRQTPEAPPVIRLDGATSGKVTGNRYRGGTIDLFNGPWLVSDNEYLGAMPGTFVYDAFAGHWLHDFTLERNRVRSIEPSGKTWRFISMNQLGQRVIIRNNDISGVGMRDDDTLPNPNAPEILLTETYRLSYEGRPSASTNAGRIVHIPMLMYGTVRPGSIVSILTGDHAGQYRTVAQPITPTTFLMDQPMPEGEYAISIAHGYVDSAIENNRIDVRGGKSAVVVLAGNHWNLRVVGNHLLGGGESMRIQSTPTENPFIWGWSHTPFLNFTFERNIHEDSLDGVSIDVESNRYTKTTSGRLYMSGVFRNNTTLWTPNFHPRNPAPIRIGASTAPDSAQMRVKLESNPLTPSTQPNR